MPISQSHTTTPETASPQTVQRHSCVLCQQRKVKCDRQKPCSNCVKASAECITSVPTWPRRRKRKLPEQDLITKLRRYEFLLKQHGIKIGDDESSDGDHSTLKTDSYLKSKGMMLADSQHSRYVENTLWEHLRDEITEDSKDLQISSDEDTHDNEIYPNPEVFLLDNNSAPKDLRFMHPGPVQIFRLWQTYLTNCNPLLKFFHAPTMQQVILDASSDLRNVPRYTEALMFSIYLLAVTSLSDQECKSMFHVARTELLTKYSHATQQALVNARFLKSLSLSTLHALCIYLLSLRRTLDHHSLWVLTGCAVRIATRLGINHDGTTHNIPPFEAEFRRRTWWQVVSLDGQASKLAGAGYPTWLGKFDNKPPLNLSDSDLSPTMKETPADKEGATEMIFCRIRAEIGGAFRRAQNSEWNSMWNWHATTSPEHIPEKDKAIDELEARFQQHYVRYCDPSIPLHLLCIYMSKSVIITMRLLAHHPRQYPDKGGSMPQREKDMLWTESLRGLEISAATHVDKAMQRFLWHTYVQFHLDAFIYVLSELRNRITGDMVDRAWRQVEIAYDNRPEMLTENKNTLYFAMGTLCLKAWTKYEGAGGRYKGNQLKPVPRYISKLRVQRKIPEPPTPPPLSPLPPQLQQPTPRNSNTQDGSSLGQNQIADFSNYMPYEYNMHDPSTNTWGQNMAMPEITPVDWEYWQTLMDGDLPAYPGDPDVPLDPSEGWIG